MCADDLVRAVLRRDREDVVGQGDRLDREAEEAGQGDAQARGQGDLGLGLAVDREAPAQRQELQLGAAQRHERVRFRDARVVDAQGCLHHATDDGAWSERLSTPVVEQQRDVNLHRPTLTATRPSINPRSTLSGC